MAYGRIDDIHFSQMNFPDRPSFRFARTFAIVISVFLLPSVSRAHDYKVLVFSKTAGYRHDSIPAGIAAIQQLGMDHDFEVVATEDATQINAANLAQFAAVVFLQTSGDFLNTSQEAALQQFIQADGGFVGVHAASTGEPAWPWYGQLMGATFTNHPAIQQATVLALDRAHPSTAVLPERWVITDEWYNFQANPRGNVHVLATLDESTYTGGTLGHDHPIAWCQDFDGGRSWYTALGHSIASYSEPLFLAHLLGGIEWAAGHAAGDAGGTVNARFEKVVLDDNVIDPMALEVAADGRVFFIERGGRLKVHSPVNQATVLVATLPVYDGHNDGLIGIALDPDFATNGWIYLCYSPVGITQENVISRFTFSNNTLVAGSERQLLRIATQRTECCHSGGAMEFASNGDLYISIGDNTNPFASDGYTTTDERAGRSAWDSQASSSNTNDLRGKILRIHPEPNGTYSIPAGNLFAPGVPLTRPEIYAMGCRSPFRMAVDPFTGYLYWGDIGPDSSTDSATRGPMGYDEINQTRTAGNYGWPYFAANNIPYRDYNFTTGVSGPAFNPNATTNNSPNNTGALNLPQARGAFIWYPYSTATAFPAIRDGSGRAMMVGDVYQHDANLVSSVAFPTYFDRTLFVMEWSRNNLYEIKTDASGNLLKIADFAPSIPLNKPIDLTFGPDGAMYLIEWGSGFAGNNPDAQIVKIIYNSTNQTPLAKASANVTSGPVPLGVSFTSAGSSDPDPGDTISFAWDFDLNGSIDSTLPNPTHVYQTADNYTAQLRVTDQGNKTGTASIAISAGNSAPVVTFDWPPDGAFFDWGDEIAWSLHVNDAEDGSTQAGGIAPAEVLLEALLGHATHAHGLSQTHGVSGTTIAQNPHGFGDDLFYALEASYVDRGAPGVAPATGRSTRILQPKCLQAEHHETAAAVTFAITADPAAGGFDVTSIDHGDFIAFVPINLLGIESIGFRLSSSVAGGSIAVHADSATGQLLATAAIPNTGGGNAYLDVVTPVTDPGGTRQLYLVFSRNPGDANLCRLNWINFHGQGVTRTAKAPRVVQISAGNPANRVTVDFDEIMDLASLTNPANYSIAGLSIGSPVADAGQKSVTLTTSPGLVADQPYVLAIHQVRDLAGDPIAPGTRVPFKTRSAVLAINAGGPAFTGADGTSYLADQSFSGGTTFGNGNAISGTTDDPIYQSERRGSFSYAIPLASGSYLVTLKFAETVANANNARVFSVTMEGNPIITNLDLHAQAGANAAYDLTFPVTMVDGVLNLGFTAAVGDPKLSGLVITRSPVPFTDFATWQTFYFGSPAATGAGPALDPDADGHTNSLEFALGGDPWIADAVRFAPSLGFTADQPSKLMLEYRKAMPGLNYQVQWTTTLAPADWSEAGVEGEVYFSPTDSFRRSVPIVPGERGKFVRLKVGP